MPTPFETKRRDERTRPFPSSNYSGGESFVIAFAFLIIGRRRTVARRDGVFISILEVEHDCLIVVEQLSGNAVVLGLVVPTHRIAALLDGGLNAQDDSIRFGIGRARESDGVRVVLSAGAEGKALSVRIHQELHVGGIVEVHGGVDIEFELVAVRGLGYKAVKHYEK